jgi:hypothetical protein
LDSLLKIRFDLFKIESDLKRVVYPFFDLSGVPVEPIDLIRKWWEEHSWLDILAAISKVVLIIMAIDFMFG